MAKLVKFNVRTEFHNIPDDKYKHECELMEKLEDEDWEKYARKLTSSRSKYQYVQVGIGQEVAVPNWYYDAHKDDKINMCLSFDKYRDASGNIIPFNTTEAIRHGDLQNLDDTMQTVSRFELVKDLDSKIK